MSFFTTGRPALLLKKRPVKKGAQRTFLMLENADRGQYLLDVFCLKVVSSSESHKLGRSRFVRGGMVEL